MKVNSIRLSVRSSSLGGGAEIGMANSETYLFVNTISSQSRVRGIKRSIWLKHDIVLKCQITFNLGLNAAKNTYHTKKVLIKSSSELNFEQKVHECICLSSPRVELGGSKDWYPNSKTSTNSCKETFSVFVIDLCKNSTYQRTPKNCSYLFHNTTMYKIVQNCAHCTKL